MYCMESCNKHNYCFVWLKKSCVQQYVKNGAFDCEIDFRCLILVVKVIGTIHSHMNKFHGYEMQAKAAIDSFYQLESSSPTICTSCVSVHEWIWAVCVVQNVAAKYPPVSFQLTNVWYGREEQCSSLASACQLSVTFYTWSTGTSSGWFSYGLSIAVRMCKGNEWTLSGLLYHGRKFQPTVTIGGCAALFWRQLGSVEFIYIRSRITYIRTSY